MTPEQQGIAIAEACGWKWIENHRFRNESFMGSKTYGDGWKNPKTGKVSNDPDEIPDYLNNLNAVHHFENYVKQDDPHAYACYASDLFEKYGSDAVSLPASVRAEELLKTIGKWIY